MTRVWAASKVEETVVWLKSEDTSGSLLTAEDALQRAVGGSSHQGVISSLVVARSAVKVRSTSETLMVGTRRAKLSNLPTSCGSTKPNGLGGAGLGQDDVGGSGAGAAQVVADVDGHLVVG